MEDAKNDMKMVETVREIVDTLGKGYVISRKELIQFVQKNHDMVEGSILPSDYCYNRINDGIKLSKPTLFEHISRGKYRCLGENYPYNGDVYHKDQVVGFCKNGVRKIYGIPREVSLDENPKVQKGRDPSSKL